MTESPRWSRIAVTVMIVLLHGVIHGHRMSAEVSFNVDVERDLTRTVGLVTGQGYPLEGPALSDSGLNLGSLYYLLLAAPVAISGDPLFLHWVFVALGGLGLALLTWVLTRHVRAEVAAVLLAWLVATEVWYDAMIWLWHSNLLPVFLGGLWLAADRIVAGGPIGWLVLAAGLASCTLSLHITAVTTLPVVVVLAWLARDRLLGGLAPRREKNSGLLAWRWVAVGAAVLVPLVPLALGLAAVDDLDHVSLASRGATESVTAGRMLEYAGSAFIPGFGTRRLFGAFPVVLGVPVLMVVIPGLALVGAILGRRRPFVRLLALAVLVAGAASWAMLGRELALRYLLVLAIPLHLLAAIGLDQLLGRWGAAPVVCAGLAAAAVALLVPGLVRDVSGDDDPGAACRMMTQRAVARHVVDGLGIPAIDVDRRVHGTVCRNATSGYRYFYKTRPSYPDKAADARKRDVHVLVMAGGVTMDANAAEVYDDRILDTPGGGTRVIAYRPWIEYAGVRRLREPGGGVSRVTVPVRAGADHVRIEVRGRGVQRCRLALDSPSGLTLEVNDGSETYLDGRVMLPRMGATTLELSVSECPGLDSIEVL